MSVDPSCLQSVGAKCPRWSFVITSLTWLYTDHRVQRRREIHGCFRSAPPDWGLGRPQRRTRLSPGQVFWQVWTGTENEKKAQSNYNLPCVHVSICLEQNGGLPWGGSGGSWSELFSLPSLHSSWPGQLAGVAFKRERHMVKQVILTKRLYNKPAFGFSTNYSSTRQRMWNVTFCWPTFLSSGPPGRFWATSRALSGCCREDFSSCWCSSCGWSCSCGRSSCSLSCLWGFSLTSSWWTASGGYPATWWNPFGFCRRVRLYRIPGTNTAKARNQVFNLQI